jgi:hypothetical protein
VIAAILDTGVDKLTKETQRQLSLRNRPPDRTLCMEELLTPKAEIWTLPFLLASLVLRLCIAGFAGTVLLLIRSHISRLRAISSVSGKFNGEVAFSVVRVDSKPAAIRIMKECV